MTKLFKNSKQVLSFVLAFAVLAVSLFTGVVINSDAACANENVMYWDGTTKTEPTDTDTDGNILISSPAELAWLVENGSSADAKYKVADGIDAFIMQPETVVDAETLMAIDSYEETKTYFETLAASENKPVKWFVKAANYSATGAFLGTFDGNGIEIYGLYHPDKAWKATALFPHVGANVTIKNLAVRNSYLAIMSYVGAVFGTSADGGDNDRITVDSVVVTGTWIYNNEASLKDNGTADTSDDYIQYFTDRSGMMFGRVAGLIDISNCLVYGNKVTNANNEDLPYAFAPSIKNNWKDADNNHSYSNCVLLGGYPYNKTSYNAYIADLFSNIYTDKPVDEGKYTYNESQMAQITVDGVKGAAGKADMNLDWDNVWFANAGIPELRVFHNVSDEATAGTNGHTVKCADCDLVSVELDHTYGADSKCTACGAEKICGSSVAYYSGTPATSIANVGGGDGSSEENAIIIASAEELAYLANGADGNTAGKYYKLSGDIDALVLQPESIGAAVVALDSTDAVKTYFETNTNSVKSWVGGKDAPAASFDGTLDGNGVTIYGLYSKSQTYGGLLPYAHACTIKNLGIKNCYVWGDRAALISNNSNEVGTLTIDSCLVTNNVVISNRLNDAINYAGLFTACNSGGNTWNNVIGSVNNCLIYGNSAKHTQYSLDYKGDKYHEKEYDINYAIFGTVSGAGHSVTNSIVLDAAPYTIYNTSRGFKSSSYSNVYTNMLDTTLEYIDWAGSGTKEFKNVTTSTINEDGSVDMKFRLYTDGVEGTTDYNKTYAAGSFIKVDADSVKGAAGAELMSELDWSNVWFANEGIPALRAFHSGFSAPVDNTDGTHSENCNCGLKGAEVAHTFDKAAADGKCTVCGGDCAHAEEDIAWVSNNNATCLTADTGHYECTACGLQDIEMENPDFVPGHKFKDVDAIPADCQGAGTIAHKLCTVCNNAFATTAADNEPIANALESTVDPIKDHTAKTDSNGDILYNMNETGHSKTCSVCNKEFAAEGHVGDYDYDADGHNGSCSVCKMATTGKENHTFVEGACTTCPYECPHNEEDIVWVSNNDGACDKADTGHYECSVCKLQDVEMENPDFVASEHKWVDDGEAVDLDYMSKTPTACKTQAQKCEKCGIAGEDKIVGHTAGEWETNPYADSKPACSGDGYHTDVLSCTECFYQIDTKTVPDPEVGHTFEDVAEQAPTCSSTGTIAHKYCEACWNCYAVDAKDNEPYENALDQYDGSMDISVDPEAHVWEEYGEDATCDEDGVVAHKYCSECYLFVVNGEEVEDVVFDYDEFNAYDENWNPVGPGAIFESNAEKVSAEAFAEFLAENYADYEFELPEFPEKPAADAEEAVWDEYYAAMDAYYTARYEIEDILWVDTEGEWWDAWAEYDFAAWLEAYNETVYSYLFAKAEAAEIDLVIPAKGHKLTEVKEVAATYEKEGTKAHYVCECGKLYADAEGKNEVTAESLVIAKLVKEDDKTSTDNKTEGDKSDKSPATGESVAAVAAVAALMGAAFVLVRKARKA